VSALLDLTTPIPSDALSGPGGKAGIAFDHRHGLETVRPYQYQDAAALLADFWAAVDEVLRQRGVIA